MKWIDGVQLEWEGKGFQDTQTPYVRLPQRWKKDVTASVWRWSRCSSGILYRFVTDSDELRVRWSLASSKMSLHHMPKTGVSGIDVYQRNAKGIWRFVKNGDPGHQKGNEITIPWTPGREGIIYLPTYNEVSDFSIGLPEGKTIQAVPPQKGKKSKPIVFYGTSITQGACSTRPGLAFTAITGRRVNVPIVNLGFCGSAKMEPKMVKLLAEIDASVYVLDATWNMNEKLLKERFEKFVTALHRLRPETPILLAEDCTVFEKRPTAKGAVLQSIYRKLKRQSPTKWRDLYYLSAEEMLPDDGDGSVDGCHLNDWGAMHQARAYAEMILKILKGK